MPDLHPEFEITQQQAEAMARGLFAIARADGRIHEREAALIAEFFHSTVEHPSDLGALERAPEMPAAALAAQLPSKDLRLAFLKTGLLLAYADGEYVGGEARKIGEYAKAFGVTEVEQTKLHQEVKEHLLAQLSHLQNVDAIAQVAKELKVS